MISVPANTKINAISATLEQEPDCCSEQDTIAQLTVSTTDGGGGPFLILNTERWSLSDNADIDAFAATLKSILAIAEQGMPPTDDPYASKSHDRALQEYDREQKNAT